MRDHELRDRVLELIETLKGEAAEDTEAANYFASTRLYGLAQQRETSANWRHTQVRQLQVLLREEPPEGEPIGELWDGPSYG